MITVNIRETDEFIKLGQALKKQVLQNPEQMQSFYSGWTGKIKRRDRASAWKKLYNGDVVSFNGETIQIVK